MHVMFIGLYIVEHQLNILEYINAISCYILTIWPLTSSGVVRVTKNRPVDMSAIIFCIIFMQHRQSSLQSLQNIVKHGACSLFRIRLLAK